MANRGTDWQAARDFWVAQPRLQRSFEDVGRQFGVSAQRVGFVARRDNWRKFADRVDEQADAAVVKRIVRSHTDRTEQVLGIVDAAFDVFEEQLDEKAREARLRDIGELFKTAQLAVGEPTDRVAYAEVQDTLSMSIEVALKYIPKKFQAAYLTEFRERLGTLGEQAA